jgi:ABC-type lipoprotein export system ATPase subunit
MRIEKIFFKNIGPFEERGIDFRDEWTGEISSKILFSGPNGSGKTTVLNCISYLWEALGYWLYEKKELPKNHPARKYIGPTGQCGMLIDGVPDFTDLKSSKTWKIFIFIFNTPPSRNMIADFNNYGLFCIGEYIDKKKEYSLGTATAPFDITDFSDSNWARIDKNNFFENWAEEYKSLILSGKDAKTPNMIYLDAEERRWVKVQKNIGKPVQEDMSKRWLYKYEASANWNSQLEASLITLKTTSLHKFHEILRLLNTFLSNKEIKPDIHPGENRLRVSIKNRRNTWHTFDQLSTGEREMLVLVYSIGRWMEKGGIVLVDEPDLFLHPGAMPDVFSAIEKLVEERGGQLIVSSHFPAMWERYENRAKRIKLEPDLELKESR